MFRALAALGVETTHEPCVPALGAPESFTRRQQGEQTVERVASVSNDGSFPVDAAPHVQQR